MQQAQPEPEKKDTATRTKTADTLRVDTMRLDRLIDLAGELLINKIKLESKTFGARSMLDTLTDFLGDFDHIAENGGRAIAKEQLQTLRNLLHEYVQELAEDVMELDVNVQDVQNRALQLRMTPASTLFGGLTNDGTPAIIFL